MKSKLVLAAALLLTGPLNTFAEEITHSCRLVGAGSSVGFAFGIRAANHVGFCKDRKTGQRFLALSYVQGYPMVLGGQVTLASVHRKLSITKKLDRPVNFYGRKQNDYNFGFAVLLGVNVAGAQPDYDGEKNFGVGVGFQASPGADSWADINHQLFVLIPITDEKNK